MAKSMNNSLKCVLVLVIIAVLSGGLLAFANKYLSVERGVNDLNKALSAEWSEVELNDGAAKTSKGSVSLVGKAETANYGDVYGLMVTTKPNDPVSRSVFIIVISKQTNCVVAAKVITDGSSGGGFSLSKNSVVPLSGFYNVPINSADVFAFDENDEIKSGATRSSTVLYYAFDIAASYYYNNLREGV